MGDRPELADRLADLSPHQREQSAVMVILCELVDELVMAVRRQSMLLAKIATAVVVNNAGQDRGAGQQAGAAAPSGAAEGDDKGGAQVQLREPGVPPVDPDETPAGGTGRAVADPPPDTAAARRQPAGKTAAKKTTPAKTATSAREGRRSA